MFKIYFVNFDYFSDKKFRCLKDAIMFAKKTGFECVVYDNNGIPVFVVGPFRTCSLAS